MYIEPNTVIRVLKNCPLDNTYDHTIWFGSLSAQTSYFMGLTKYTFPAQTYQRVNKGVMRLYRKADDLYDCNYLMFQNSSFGTKWFYAFITSVEYVNNTTAEITYEIDPMMTWWFDFTVRECLVEREHAMTDEPGDNLVPENLELGEYTTSGEAESPTTLDELSIVVGVTFAEGEETDPYQGVIRAGLYQGINYGYAPMTEEGAKQVNNFLNNTVQKVGENGILGIFAMPAYFAANSNTTEIAEYDHRISKFNSGANLSFEGYIPKNNKLYTYPYNFLYVTNNQGSSAEFHYEYFDDPDSSDCGFDIICDMSMNPTMILLPRWYKHVRNRNYDEKLTISGFPQLPWNTDVFKAWVAMNASNIGIDALSTALSGAIGNLTSGLQVLGGFATGNVGMAAGGVMKAANNASSTGSQLLNIATNALKGGVLAAKMPGQGHTGSGGTTLAADKHLNFTFYKKHIRGEFARIIDDYFDKFGYACHRVKVPNISGRPHWNYVKTIGCTVTGSLPADDMNKICKIYDNGITFWKNGNEVGDYSLDNRI